MDRITEYSTKAIRDLVQEVGVNSAWPRPICCDRPSIHLQTMSQWWTGDHHVAQSVLDEAVKNELKLREAPAPRYLLVWIEFEDIASTFEITKDGPPEKPVALPEFVDVAWAATGFADNAALWRAEDGMPWTVAQTMEV